MRRGPYKLLHKLGEGGMGTVWLAKHRDTGAHVALKTLNTLDARLLHRFRREIRTLSQLDHPGVVELIDHAEESNGHPWYAMRLLRGRPLLWHLRQVTERLGPAPSGELDDESEFEFASTELRSSGHWTSKLTDLERLLTSPPTKLGSDQPTPRLGQARGRASLLGRASTITAIASSISTETALTPAHIDRRTPRPWPNRDVSALLGYITQVCETLAYLHGEGIVHCDIKPENIVITDTGEAILVDFGIADRFGARVEHEALEAAGVQAGTAHYISPEQIRGEPVDARTDLYALGCVLYEILTGAPPFVRGSATSILLQHLSHRAAPLHAHSPELPPALDELVLELLAKKPTERIGHARAVATTLAGCGIPRHTWPSPDRPKPYLYKPMLAGREALLTQLTDLLHATKRGDQVGAVTLGGESGMGKSRLAAEIIARARNMGFFPVTAQCQGSQEGGELRPGPALHAFRPILRQVADACLQGGEELFDELFGRRGKLLEPYAPFLTNLPGAARYETPASLPTRQARQRLFFALDETLCAISGPGPLLILIDDAHHADELSLDAMRYLARRARQHEPRRAWFILVMYSSEQTPARLERLLRARHWNHHKLDRLGEPAVRALCAQMLGVTTPEDALVELVTRRGSGNPYFIAEYLRRALETGLMSMDERGRWHLTDRDALSRFQIPDSVQALLADRLDRLDDVARAVCDVAAVIGARGRLRVLSKVLDMQRSISGAALDAALAQLGAREILVEDTRTYQFTHEQLREAAYQALDPAERQTLHASIAEVAGARKRASAAMLGHHFERSGQLERARVAYLEGARRARAEHALESSWELFERAITLTDRHGTLALRLELVQDVLLPARELDSAQTVLTNLVRDSRDLDALHVRAQALTLTADVSQRQGDLARAERCLKEAADRFEALASGQGKADTTLGMARLKLANIELGRAHTYARAATEEYRRVKDTHGQLRSQLVLGDVCTRLDRLREAESCFKEARKLAQRIAKPRQDAEGAVWLAELAHRAGRIADALDLATQAWEVFERLDDPSGLAQVEIVRSRLACDTKNHQEMRAHANKALALLERTWDPHHEVLAIAELARAAHDLGDDAEYRALKERAEHVADHNVIARALAEFETIER